MGIRIYVGGLSPEIKENELIERFNKIENIKIQNIQIIMNQFLHICRGFAYINLLSKGSNECNTEILSEEQKAYETYRSWYHNTKWKGHKLRIEMALPNYMDRLHQEWKEQKKIEQTKIETIHSNDISKDTIHSIKPENEIIKLGSTVKKSEKGNIRFLKSNKIIFYYDEVENMDKKENNELSNQKTLIEFKKPSDLELKIVKEIEIPKQETVKKNFNENSKAAKIEANKIRIEALSLKKKIIDENKNNNINILQSQSKKIIFDSDGENHEIIKYNNDIKSSNSDISDDIQDVSDKIKPSITDWLSDSGDDKLNDGLDTDKMFSFRPEYHGKEGKKLFELNKKFGGDSRFKLNKNFVDNDSNDEQSNRQQNMNYSEEFFDDQSADIESNVEEKNYENKTSSQFDLSQLGHNRKRKLDEEMRQEVERSLNVMGHIFPYMNSTKTVTSTNNDNTVKNISLKENNWNKEVERYDPTNESSKCLEICHEKKKEKKKKKNLTNEAIDIESNDQKQRNNEHANTNDSYNKPLSDANDSKFFQVNRPLNSMFTRVRKNSEDGIEGEAALDGVGTTTSDKEGFSFGKMFGINEDEEKSETKFDLIDTKTDIELTCLETSNDLIDMNSNDSDQEDSDELQKINDDISVVAEDKNLSTFWKNKRNFDDLLEFGRTFKRPNISDKELDQNWINMRKKLTISFRRKFKEAMKIKKAKRNVFKKIDKSKQINKKQIKK